MRNYSFTKYLVEISHPYEPDKMKSYGEYYKTLKQAEAAIHKYRKNGTITRYSRVELIECTQTRIRMVQHATRPKAYYRPDGAPENIVCAYCQEPIDWNIKPHVWTPEKYNGFHWVVIHESCYGDFHDSIVPDNNPNGKGYRHDPEAVAWHEFLIGI